MLKRYRRNRRLRRLKEIGNPVIGTALQCLDRPTDLKDEFSLRQTLDLDTLHVHSAAASLAEKYDGIVSKDIRLATLRLFLRNGWCLCVSMPISHARMYLKISVQFAHFIPT